MTAVAPADPQTRPATTTDGWGFGHGDEIAPGRTALTLLGGGRRYEAYLAFDDLFLTTVVVKVLRPSRVEDPSALEGIAHEWQALQATNHPSIARGFDAVLDGPRPHLVLEHIEGPRLSTLLRRFGPLAVDQLVPLAIQVTSALHYLHRTGLVHLDVKPQNIIMAGPPRLIDLSVAETVEDAARLRSVVGTDAYMAPEQSAPSRQTPVGAAADIWGVGATLYEAATGRRPFPRGTDTDPYPQRHLAPVPPGRDVPAALAEAILQTLEPDPSQRPTALQLTEALTPLVDALPRRMVLGNMRPRWR